MGRKEWRKQQAQRRRTDKAWKEAEQFDKHVLEAWLKEGEMSAEEVNQLCDKVRGEFVQVLDYHKMPIGLTRMVLMTMMAESLAHYATDSDGLVEDATIFGKTLVNHALEIFDLNSTAH